MGAISDQFLRILYGGPLRRVSSHCFFAYYMWASSDLFVSLIPWGPFRSVYLLLYGGPLRSVSSHTIWGPLQISFFTYHIGPPQTCFFAYYMGAPRTCFFAYYMRARSDSSFRLLYGAAFR